MPFKKNSDDEIKYELDQEWGDHIIEEGGNTSLNLRMISWNDRGYKLDLRKYAYRDGQERPMKGVTMSEEAGHELAKVLVSKGYGDTYAILRNILSREDYTAEMLDPDYQPPEKPSEDDYYDPKELLSSGVVVSSSDVDE